MDEQTIRDVAARKGVVIEYVFPNRTTGELEVCWRHNAHNPKQWTSAKFFMELFDR